MFEISKRLALGAALTAPVVGFGVPVDAAHAANPPPPLKNQCVTPELTAAQMAAGTKSVLSCFTTFAEAMASIGVRVDANATAVGFAGASAAATSILAVSFQGSDGTGWAMTVYGTDCNGGGTSLPAQYDNAISSTTNYLCSQVKHFENSDYTGATQNVTGGWGSRTNINTAMNDKTSSIKYYGPLN